MTDNRITPNYFNSVYNNKNISKIINEPLPQPQLETEISSNYKQANNFNLSNPNLNESKELKEINHRLDFYINSVKDLTHFFKYQSSNHSSNTSNQSQWSSFSPNNNSLLASMKNLEKDLEALKHLYEEEIKLMKFEIEELSIVKNKYSLENFNLELKLKDFVVKFEDLKKSNDELVNEIADVKAQKNRLEFELENSKLEYEKPLRENKQLKKDLEDLLNKLNEKQAISDSEIAYRQDLETKFKELKESFTFEKKINDQEIDNFKSQSKLFQDTISELEKKLNETLAKENSYIENINDLKSENHQLRNQNQQLEEQNDSLRAMCQNLESVIRNLEQMKNTLEEKIANTERNMNQSSLSNQINSIKSKLEAEEFRLQQLVNATKTNPNSPEPGAPSRVSINTTNHLNTNLEDDAKLSENIGNLSQRSNQIKSVRQQVPFGQITNTQNQSKQISSTYTNQNRPYTVKSPEQLTARLSANNSSPDVDYQIGKCLSNNQLPSDYPAPEFSVPPSYSLQPALQYQQTVFQSPNLTTPSPFNMTVPSSTPSNQRVKFSADYKNKDITNDLFNNFEKTTILNQGSSTPNPKKEISSSVSSIDNTVTEASFVGNIKIHEVNKNGYYVRILNVSNTHEEDLSNYTIQQMVSTMPVAIYRLPQSTKILPGHTITVWSRTDEVEQQPPHTFVWYEQEKWGTGPECTTILAKPNGQAVSWTTGCHKYGNIDNDDLLSVYSTKRNKPTVQLDRQKLVPKKIFSPTKHPHGSMSRLGNIEDSTTKLHEQNQSSKLADPNGFQRSFFCHPNSKPSKTEISKKSQSNMTSSAKNVNELQDIDTIFQQNYSFFRRPLSFNQFL